MFPMISHLCTYEQDINNCSSTSGDSLGMALHIRRCKQQRKSKLLNTYLVCEKYTLFWFVKYKQNSIQVNGGDW